MPCLSRHGHSHPSQPGGGLQESAQAQQRHGTVPSRQTATIRTLRGQMRSRRLGRNSRPLFISPKGQELAPWSGRPGCCGFIGPVPSATLDKRAIAFQEMDSAKSLTRSLFFCQAFFTAAKKRVAFESNAGGKSLRPWVTWRVC